MKKKRSRLKTSLQLALITFGTLVGALFASGTDRLSLGIFDFLQNSTLRAVPSPVALVIVDQNSLNSFKEEGIDIPLPRQIYGAMAQVAKHLSAKMIVFDLLFTEPSHYGVSDDKLFAELLKDSGIPAIFPSASQDLNTKMPIPEIAAVAAGFGSINSLNDSDGVFRRYLGHRSIANVVFQKMNPNVSLNAPEFLRNYDEKSFAFEPLYNIIKAYRELGKGQAFSVDLSKLKDKIWVVGYTAPGTYDLKALSTDRSAPGMLIPATAIANVLQSEGLHKFPQEWAILISFLIAFVCLITVNLFKTPAWSIAGLSVVGLGCSVMTCYSLWFFNVWQSPLPFLLSGFTAGLGQMGWLFQTVWRDQLRMAGILRHSMSPQMVELVRSGEIQISRFGETRNITVLFSDLEGFTDLSEQLQPHELVEILNEYFDEVVALITASSGYVDKFIGDAVMALWSAPVQLNDHATFALNAATQFHHIVMKCNERLKLLNPNLKPLRTRVGLNTGPAVIGNVGAKNRHNYTAIGDTVNLSARLEGLCKMYGVDILISESTIRAADAQNLPGVLELDQVRVKGKATITRIFTYAPQLASELSESYKSGLKCYYEGRWDDAISFFESLEFPPSQIMANRCRLALQRGGLKEMRDGAWTFESK